MKENTLNTFGRICFKTVNANHLLHWDSERVQNNKVKAITVVSQKRLLNRFAILFA